LIPVIAKKAPRPRPVTAPTQKGGVKGMLPLGCLPLWGREGVTLIAAVEINFMTKKEVRQRIEIEPFFSQFCYHFFFCNFPLVISDQFLWLKQDYTKMISPAKKSDR
jgi:hypothetical protein